MKTNPFIQRKMNIEAHPEFVAFTVLSQAPNENITCFIA